MNARHAQAFAGATAPPRCLAGGLMRTFPWTVGDSASCVKVRNCTPRAPISILHCRKHSLCFLYVFVPPFPDSEKPGSRGLFFPPMVFNKCTYLMCNHSLPCAPTRSPTQISSPRLDSNTPRRTSVPPGVPLPPCCVLTPHTGSPSWGHSFLPAPSLTSLWDTRLPLSHRGHLGFRKG